MYCKVKAATSMAVSRPQGHMPAKAEPGQSLICPTQSILPDTSTYTRRTTTTLIDTVAVKKKVYVQYLCYLSTTHVPQSILPRY